MAPVKTPDESLSPEERELATALTGRASIPEPRRTDDAFAARVRGDVRPTSSLFAPGLALAAAACGFAVFVSVGSGDGPQTPSLASAFELSLDAIDEDVGLVPGLDAALNDEGLLELFAERPVLSFLLGDDDATDVASLDSAFDADLLDEGVWNDADTDSASLDDDALRQLGRVLDAQLSL